MLRLYLYARVRFSHIFARETAGAASTRHSLRPLNFGRTSHQQLGRIAPRDCGHTFIVIARLDRATQYAAASRSSSSVSGILDRPVKPGADLREDKNEF